MFGNINKLYKTVGKYDDQQQYKSMIEKASVSTPEGCNGNSSTTQNDSNISQYCFSPQNKCARKYLKQF